MARSKTTIGRGSSETVPRAAYYHRRSKAWQLLQLSGDESCICSAHTEASHDDVGAGYKFKSTYPHFKKDLLRRAQRRRFVAGG